MAEIKKFNLYIVGTPHTHTHTHTHTHALTHTHTHTHTPFLKGGGLTLPKIPRKGGMEKLLKGRGILRRGDAVSGIFPAGVW